MKLNTTKQFLYTADYYSYTLVTSADGTVTTKQYVTAPAKVSTSLTTNFFGELVIESLYKMQLEGYLKNVLDRKGEEIYEGGVWKIIATQPILDGLGNKYGYRYRAELIEGQI